MILFDLFVNKRRIDLFEIILIIFLACSIAMTYIGDKIWNEDEYLREIHHKDPHFLHKKHGIIYRRESNISGISNEDEYPDENENFKKHQHKSETPLNKKQKNSRKSDEKDDSERKHLVVN